MVVYIESKNKYILSYNPLIALLLLFRVMQIYTDIQFLYKYLYIYSLDLINSQYQSSKALSV